MYFDPSYDFQAAPGRNPSRAPTETTNHQDGTGMPLRGAEEEGLMS
jgi:hypothetical protein